MSTNSSDRENDDAVRRRQEKIYEMIMAQQGRKRSPNSRRDDDANESSADERTTAQRKTLRQDRGASNPTEEKLGPEIRKRIEGEQYAIMERIQEENKNRISPCQNEERSRRSNSSKSRAMDAFDDIKSEQRRRFEQFQNSKKPALVAATVSSDSPGGIKRKSVNRGHVLERASSRQQLYSDDTARPSSATASRNLKDGKEHLRKQLTRLGSFQKAIETLRSLSEKEQKEKVYEMAEALRSSYATTKKVST